MIPYLIIFVINIILSHIADITYIKKECAITYKTSLLLLLLLNVFFAGSRDFGVGIDTTIYIDYYYDIAKYSNNLLMLFFNNDDDLDLAFLIMAKISTLFGESSQSLLYVVAAEIYGFILLGCHEYKKTVDFKMSIFFILFGLMHYCASLNLMRQYCAMAVLFYAFSFVLQNRWKYYIVLQILAFFFHSSSIVFLCISGLYYTSKLSNPRTKVLISISVILSVLLVLVSYYYLTSLLGNLGILYEVYQDRYGADSVYLSNSEFSLVKELLNVHLLLPFILTLLLIYSARNREITSEYEHYLLLNLYILSILVSKSGYIMVFFGRFSYYFTIIYIIFLAKVIGNRRSNFLFYVPLVIYYLYDWCFHNFIDIEREYGWSFAYTSKILGID